MDPFFLSIGAVIAIAIGFRFWKRQTGSILSPASDRPRCSEWEKSATAELLDEIELAEAKRRLRKKILQVLADEDEAERLAAEDPPAAVTRKR